MEASLSSALSFKSTSTIGNEAPSSFVLKSSTALPRSVAPFSSSVHSRASPSCARRVIPVPRCSATSSTGETSPNQRIIRGPCFVLGDNIDTDQIIPAEYLTLLPDKPDEYRKLGSYALCGLPARYTTRFIEAGEETTRYPVIIGGANFGCGSSREHAPVALGAAGCRVVVAESYARIFFRNSVATGEVYPVEAESRLCDTLQTGEEVTVDLEHDLLIRHKTGEQMTLKPIGEAGPVIEAGGIFNYARNSGMIAAK